MTLSSIRTQLLSHFLEHDTFFLKDIENIKVHKDLNDFKKSMVEKSLADLEETKIVKRIKSNSIDSQEDAWILESPLSSHGQQIYVSLPLSNVISETINTFLEANKLGEDRSNPLSLSEKDIATLLGIINELLEGQTEEDDDDEEQK